MTKDTPEHAGMMIPPPLLFVGGLAAGLTLNHVVPRRWLPPRVARALGGACVALGLTLGGVSFGTMEGAGTAADPREPSTTLVDRGPFRYSRNPIYLSFTLIYVGVASLANSLWAMLVLPIPLVLIRRQVVRREEPYLTRTFGAQYTEYRARVRRWI
ncbi:MAG: isoprenylcysteine carboxylmethyltransferase family protein [Herpetosiphon sp.]